MNDILDTVFNEVLKEDFVEVIPNIPNGENNKYAVCWRLVTEIDISQRATEIELHIGLSDNFPYEIPDIYFLDKRYDYFPHVDFENRKLCLFEDDSIINATAPLQVLKSCIRQAKKLIECGVNKQNECDFIEEIANYWILPYNGEKSVDTRYIVYGQPKNKCLLNIVTNVMGVKMIVADEELNNIKRWFVQCGCTEKVLFMPSVKVASKPPYNMSYGDFFNLVNKEEKEAIRSFVSKYSQLNILFPLSDNHLYGGYHLGYINTNLNGFRPGKVSPTKVLDLKYRNKKMPRITAYAYNKARIEERTSGVRQANYTFAVMGCGSIGSNLCTFLNAYNDVSFVLVDNDMFSVDNIGRHILGINDVFYSKVDALKNSFLSVKPEMKINVCRKNMYDINPNIVTDCNAVFLCTGNLSAEYYFVRQLEKNELKRPIFVLWLEPYAIAGHLIYVSETDGYKTFRNCFDAKGNYKYNMIATTEYEKPALLKKRDAGCNGSYVNYSGNDVMLFLSSMYPLISEIIENKTLSTCYRWVGNINTAKEKGIALTNEEVRKNQINIYPCQQ